MSQYKLLIEKVKESNLVIVGVVLDSHVRLDRSISGELSNQGAEVREIKVEKKIKGGDPRKEIFTVERLPLTLESPIYSKGERVLMFLKKLSPHSELLSENTENGENQPDYSPYYSILWGDQGCLYLGLDSKTTKKLKISDPAFHQKLLQRDLKSADTKTKNQKFLKAIHEVVRISQIKGEKEQRKAWEKTLQGDDEILKENARRVLEGPK